MRRGTGKYHIRNYRGKKTQETLEKNINKKVLRKHLSEGKTRQKQANITSNREDEELYLELYKRPQQETPNPDKLTQK